MDKYLKRAWAEIHLDRLRRNVEKCKSLIGPRTEMMSVVKANCYGHGCERIIPFLETELDINWFAVSNLIEAQELRNLGVTGEILILGYTPPDMAQALIKNDIIQSVTELSYAEELSKYVPDGESVRVHIKLDTGMTRIGLRHPTVDGYCDEAEKIAKIPKIEVEGIFTHLSVADSDKPSDIEYTNKQIALFKEIRQGMKKRLVVLKQAHFLNSAGAAYHYDEASTLARFGIMLYGLKPNSSLPLPVELEPVMELKACVSQVKEVEEGVSVSYGRTFTTSKKTKIATVTIGYADGYSRLLSSKAQVLINGKRADVIGRVCMDQLMIDVTGIDAKPGDVVTLFGSDGNEHITADELADLYGTIGYEIICGISPRVPRVYIE